MYQRCLLLLMVCCFVSCKKQEENTCDYKTTVVFQCKPDVGGTYTGYIDGIVIRTFNPGETGMYQEDTGYHILQVKGGIPYMDNQDTVHLAPCETAIMTFP